jgi:hypothetical protein
MRHRSRAVWLALAGATALVAGAPLPARAAEVALRYSRFLYPGAAGGAFHLSLAVPAGKDLGLALDAARFSADGSGVYALTGGIRTMGRGGRGPTFFAQVMAGVAWQPGDGAIGMLQPGFGVDLGWSGGAAVRLQVDWPLITFSGPIFLVPQVSLGVVFRPDP